MTKMYVQKDLLDLPEITKNSNKTYNGIIVCPTGQTRLDNQYMEFAIIGCRDKLEPAEIITCVHAAQFDFLLKSIKGAIKFDMVGFGIVRIWSNQYFMTFNLNSVEDLDLELIPRDNARK